MKIFYHFLFLLTVFPLFSHAEPFGDCIPYPVLYGKDIIYDLNQKPILSLIESDLKISNLLGRIPSFNLFQQTQEKQYYPNGDLMVNFQFNESTQSGVQNIFYENGNLMSVTPFSNNLINGTQKIYYRNGPIMATIPYVNGLLNGQLKTYYPNGNIQMKQSYLNNRPIDTYLRLDDFHDLVAVIPAVTGIALIHPPEGCPLLFQLAKLSPKDVCRLGKACRRGDVDVGSEFARIPRGMQAIIQLLDPTLSRHDRGNLRNAASASAGGRIAVRLGRRKVIDILRRKNAVKMLVSVPLVAVEDADGAVGRDTLCHARKRKRGVRHRFAVE